MGLTPRGRRLARFTVIPVTLAAWICGATLRTCRPVHADQSAGPATRAIDLGSVRAGSLYALSLSVKDPKQIQANDAVRVTVKDSQGEVESKWLHRSEEHTSELQSLRH